MAGDDQSFVKIVLANYNFGLQILTLQQKCWLREQKWLPQRGRVQYAWYHHYTATPTEPITSHSVGRQLPLASRSSHSLVGPLPKVMSSSRQPWSCIIGLAKTLSTLHSLAIKGFGHFSISPLYVEIPLAASLFAQLNLVDCTVRCLSGALADCLQGLTSLSPHNRTVYGDNDFTVTQVTNLLELDLAKAAWLVDDHYLNLESFVGWLC
ncbi:TPA: hypothetical protein ACH3X1_005995 [Trebouxia sp. C0004]